MKHFRSILVWLALAMVIATVAKAQEKVVQVPANQAWTRTGIMLNPGQTVRITASGAVEASPPSDPRPFYHQVPPEGRLERFANAPEPLLPDLALLGRIGNGPVLLVGGGVQLTAGAPYGSGELILGINDDAVSDNSIHLTP